MSAKDTQVAGSHYKDMAIQPAEFIHANGIGYLAGNVIKYLCRYKRKNGRQDLEKAKHYIDLLIEQEYPDVYDASDERDRRVQETIDREYSLGESMNERARKSR